MRTVVGRAAFLLPGPWASVGAWVRGMPSTPWSQWSVLGTGAVLVPMVPGNGDQEATKSVPSPLSDLL